mgnify:CR=1 FL=1
MDSNELVTEALQRLAPELQPLSITREDDQPLWYVALEDDIMVAVSCLEDQRKVVCWSSIASAAMVDENNWDAHQGLLTEAQIAAESDGPSIGLDDEGIVLFYELPLTSLSPESLLPGIIAVRSAASYWTDTLEGVDQAPAPDPAPDVTGAIRV